MEGLLLVDKPAGLTSHDVVARVRRWSGERRVGHAGTLDPAATGLLVLLLGRATRLAQYLTHTAKRYQALIHLGVSTSTDDAEGEVLATAPVQFELETLQAAVASFLGEQLQVPPAYAAIKVKGEPLYRRARRGETVIPEPRRVHFYALELLDWTPPYLRLEVTCSAGTYIRSLARDLGQRLGCGGHLRELRRLASGSFTLEDSLSLEQVQALAEAGKLAEALLPPTAALATWPRVTLDPDLARAMRHGQTLTLPDLAPAPHVCAFAEDGHWLGLLIPQADGIWRPDLVWEGL